MKTDIVKMSVVALIIATFATSCVPRFVDARTGQPLGQQGGGHPQGGHQQSGRSLTPYYPGQQPAGRVQTGTRQVQTGTKKTSKFIGGFTVQLWNSEDMGLKQQARTVTEEYFRANGDFPSDEYVSQKIGHKCRLTNKRAG